MKPSEAPAWLTITSARGELMTHPQVLLVEDEVLVRMTMASVLDRAGFHVIAAANANEALEVLTAVSGISVVVADVKLSGSTMNGFDLARKVWAEWHIPVLVTSGRTAPDEDELPSAIHFIAKPLRTATLVYMINTMIGEGAARGAQSASGPAEGTDKAGLMAVSDLSPRLQQVLELLVQGRTNRDIAAAMNVADGTAKVHVSALLRRLGVTNRTEAVAVGMRLLKAQ